MPSAILGICPDYSILPTQAKILYKFLYLACSTALAIIFYAVFLLTLVCFLTYLYVKS